MRWIATVLLAIVCGCVTSPRPLPLATPETLKQGISQIDQLLLKGQIDEAKAYIERHKSVDPVIYWAFQVHMSDCLWSHDTNRIPAMTSYSEFLKAYQERFINGRESNNGMERDHQPLR